MVEGYKMPEEFAREQAAEAAIAAEAARQERAREDHELSAACAALQNSGLAPDCMIEQRRWKRNGRPKPYAIVGPAWLLARVTSGSTGDESTTCWALGGNGLIYRAECEMERRAVVVHDTSTVIGRHEIPMLTVMLKRRLAAG